MTKKYKLQTLKISDIMRAYKRTLLLFFFLFLKVHLLAQEPSIKINQSLNESKALLDLFSKSKINKLDFLIQIRDKFRVIWNFNQEVKVKEQENIRLKQEKVVLANENNLLKGKNTILEAKNDSLKQENDTLRQIIKKKDAQILVLQSDSIYLEDIVLKAEEVIIKQEKEILELKNLEDTLRLEMINSSFRVEITYSLKRKSKANIGVIENSVVYLSPTKITNIRVYFHTGVRINSKRVPAVSTINCQIPVLNLNTIMNRTSQDVYEANISITGKQSVYYPNLKKLKKNGNVEIRTYYIDPNTQQEVELKEINFTIK